MTDAVQPTPPDPARPNLGAARGAAAPSPHPSAGIRPQSAEQRRRDVITASILIGLMLLGIAAILFLAHIGWIWTPWYSAPSNATTAGKQLWYSVQAGFSLILGIPIAGFVILIGHVSVYILRRTPLYRHESSGSGRGVMTLFLVVCAVCLVTAYLALGTEVYRWVTFNPAY